MIPCDVVNNFKTGKLCGANPLTFLKNKSKGKKKQKENLYIKRDPKDGVTNCNEWNLFGF